MISGYDSLALKISDDILSLIKQTIDVIESSNYTLPEDVSESILYEFNDIHVDCDLTIDRDPLLKRDYILDARLSGEDTIEITLILNPYDEPCSYQNIYYELIETTRHEIQHARQYVDQTLPLAHGADRNFDNISGINYYLQEDELDAQIAGFSLLSEITKTPFEDLIRVYYINKMDQLEITMKDIEKLIKKIKKLKNNYLNNYCNQG